MTEKYLKNGEEFKKEFSSIIEGFFKLPSYAGNSELFDEQTRIQKIKTATAEAYYHLIKDKAWTLVRSKKEYAEAISVVKNGLKNLNYQSINKHDAKAIEIFFLRRLGRIYEHWATFGEAEKSKDDPIRQQHFLLAAYYYMLGEIELGIMTEFASRISESLRGTGLASVAAQFDMAFWKADIGYADGTDKALLDSQGYKIKTEKSGGVRTESWVSNLPDITENGFGVN